MFYTQLLSTGIMQKVSTMTKRELVKIGAVAGYVFLLYNSHIIVGGS